MTNFTAFFESLWKSESWLKPEPFPWQAMLAERGASGDWPEAINLPTASGKTACLDAAVFALAGTADNSSEDRMPRRIWFVVDRRIVVDEAYERARKIARRLGSTQNSDGPAGEIAARLRNLSGTGRPLAVARLRGGAWRDDGWVRLPSQPAIICSTVDQVGSALLFRAYSHSDRTASIFAGLAGNDSLILLDEAHCAVPFMQTLRAVARYRAEQWAARPLKTPFRFSIMSATLPPGIREDATFPRATERFLALDHPILQQRLTAGKAAALMPPLNDEKFVVEAASCARTFAGADPLEIGKLVPGFEAAAWAARLSQKQGKPRVAVMVNRVATAEQIVEGLRKEPGGNSQIVLLTGRMRPLDRGDVVKEWESKLKAGSSEIFPKPVILVTTQCLEVGADFSFDALVTECASLDALRQRFGRLDRLGMLGKSPAAILIREHDKKEPKGEEGDPIYGRAIYETWKWLTEQSTEMGVVDFGVQAMEALTGALRADNSQRFEQLLAPFSDAPVLLPAHLDMLCQTSPHPEPEPDVTLFLHGKDRGAPEVRVVLRTDLPELVSDDKTKDAWLDILSVVPPTSAEMLTVPLYHLRRWLTEGQPEDTSGDVEGAAEPAGEENRTSVRTAPFLIWRGRDRSKLTRDVKDIRPDDVVVLPVTENGLDGLGQTIADPTGAGANRLDLAERALGLTRGRVVLRLQKDVLAPWRDHASIKALLDPAMPEAEHADIEEALQAVLTEDMELMEANREVPSPALPKWLWETVHTLIKDGFRVEDHPAGGLILTGLDTRRREDRDEEEDDPLADDDLTSESKQAVSLQDHTATVCSVTSEFVERCLPNELQEAFSRGAQAHDLGKLDRRFQIMLRNGAEEEVEAGPPLAKSASLPERRRRRVEIREDLRLPAGFRHEFLSLQLAQHFSLAPTDSHTGDLMLHLVGSHHGHARPFAPVVGDPMFEKGRMDDLSLGALGIDATLTADDRRALTPTHRLDSGVPERFWRLTRRYGWWGLAYLEAIFRLADWKASRSIAQKGIEEPHLSPSPRPPAPSSYKIAFDALDGANPLAFLASLGALRILTRVLPGDGPRLSWCRRLGAWRPTLWIAKPVDEEAMVSALHGSGVRLEEMFSPELLASSEAASPKNKKGEARWKDKLLFPVIDLRKFCEAATESPGVLAEFSATWAGETAPTEQEGETLARRTRFDFTAGQQAFIRMLRELRETCTPADLRRSLFTGWHYSATATSMRWDTQDAKRQYALQAVDPTNGSENPPLADLGANFLAIEGLPLFPLVPGRNRTASQPGFDRDAAGRRWRWPIWTCPLGLDAIRSLLTLPLEDSEEWTPSRRLALGVSALFESGIVQPSGRYRCFTPAQII